MLDLASSYHFRDNYLFIQNGLISDDLILCSPGHLKSSLVLAEKHADKYKDEVHKLRHKAKIYNAHLNDSSILPSDKAVTIINSLIK